MLFIAITDCYSQKSMAKRTPQRKIILQVVSNPPYAFIIPESSKIKDNELNRLYDVPECIRQACKETVVVVKNQDQKRQFQWMRESIMKKDER